jgi:hypothetical protein
MGTFEAELPLRVITYENEALIGHPRNAEYAT